MNDVRLVSVIIPCRNEEKYIGQCVDSIIANDYPHAKLEILVVDGMSEDGTRSIVERYVQQYAFVRLVDNPKRIIPFAMNIGIRNAKGIIIMKIDAHSSYEKDYISECVRYLYEYDADNVGGIWKMVPRNNTLLGKSIVLALASPFGAGDAYYKTGSKTPRWVDTVPFGCYRKEVFDRIGLYDENIARSEDVAINSRLRRAGGRILLVPEIVIYYYARSTFKDFCQHSFDNGFWVTYPLKFGRLLFSLRHLVPLAFVLGLIVLLLLSVFSSILLWLLLLALSLYLVASICFSVKLAVIEKDLRYVCILPIVFAVFHIVYGLGSLYGLLKLLIPR